MTLPDAIEIIEYWRDFPPEHEILSMLAQVYTTWKPAGAKPMTEEEARVEHQKSLKQRWNAGAMSARDLATMGGVIAKQSPGQ